MYILSLLSYVIAFSAGWAFDYFGLSCFEQIIFHLKVPLEGTNTQFIKDWVIKCFLKALVVSFTQAVIFRFPDFRLYYGSSCIAAFLICLCYGIFRIGLPEYIFNQFRFTDLYETYYADGRNVKLAFPEKKRNLILLYVESLETTYTCVENGGAYGKDIIPELTKIAEENLNFSHQDRIGGAHVVAGTGWTTGGLVGQSTGVPLCVPFRAPSFRSGGTFLNGAYGIGDILSSEGYQQEFLIGSDAVFGGRKFFYDNHGKFQIFDLHKAREENRIPEDYRVFWGYEDEKLFDFARDEITKLSQSGEPFHITMLTVDTHHPYGYADDSYCDEYPERLSNIIRGSSRKIGAFVDWLREQPFYNDTTIVITGDHLSMAAEYINKTYDRKYDRTVFNAFINSAVQTKNNKNRIFTSFDMFPTILSAMGVKIEGEKLGLGVNLFSGKKTVAEEIGLSKLDQELRKQSRYYNEKIL